jgi:hypothetical protein
MPLEQGACRASARRRTCLHAAAVSSLFLVAPLRFPKDGQLSMQSIITRSDVCFAPETSKILAGPKHSFHRSSPFKNSVH